MKPQPEKLILCPTCREVDTTPEFSNARGPVETFPLVRCRRCGLVFQQRARSFSMRDAAQEEAYGVPQKRFTPPVEFVVRSFRKGRVALARKLMPPGGRTLDIGCGRAVYLRMLQERGYVVRGTELSEATARNADPAVPIDTGEIEPDRYADGSFDLISIWHVLEHVPEPDRTLATCARALAPDGVLAIAVPNYGSAQARFGGAHWFHLDLPRHIFHFTQDSLSALLHEQGLEIRDCRTGQWEMDPFGWVQTALNRLGLRHNALYDTLRNHPEVKRDLSPTYRTAMLALFPLGMLLALPLSLFFRCFGRAGTLIILARKPAPGTPLGMPGDSGKTSSQEIRR